MLPTRDPLQIERHTQTGRKGMEKDISCKWERKKTGASILISGKTDFKIKSITKDKGGPTSFTSEYLSKEIQNTNLKRYMYLFGHCSIL